MNGYLFKFCKFTIPGNKTMAIKNKIYGIIIHKTKIWEHDIYVAYNPVTKKYCAFKPSSYFPPVKGDSLESAVMDFVAVYVY